MGDVVPLPVVKRSCFDCQHYESFPAGPGHCHLFDEAIDSEIYAARHCAGFEHLTQRENT